MKRFGLHIKRYLMGLAAALAMAATPAMGVDNVWTGAVNLDYNEAGNWLLNSATFVPDAGEGGFAFNEIAVINNGHHVYLDSDTGSLDPSGLTIANASSLEVRNGGVLNIDPTEGTPGMFPGNISLSANSTLTIRSGGTLTAVGTAALNGTTQLVGSTATFTAGGFTLGGSHTLQARITSAASHSPLVAPTGGVALNGNLEVDLRGISPTVGNSWVIADAASITGGFSNISTWGLPLGQTVSVAVSGGGHGQRAIGTIENQLVMYVNSSSGEATINNLSASSPITIDGYSLTSSAPVLNPAGWLSFQDDGHAAWEAANAASNHISELAISGNRTLNGGASVSLGALLLPVTQFGAATTPVEFTYHLENGGTKVGAVVQSSTTLELQVDPSTGQAQIVNPSGFNVEIDGYSIVSSSGALDTNNWHSFQQDGQTGWEVANASSIHLSELNLQGTRSLAKLEQGAPISLGSILLGGAEDLEFTFHATVEGVLGDYNNDGTVDATDYVVWRNNLGAPAGTLPNDAHSGPIGAAQYATWKANYGTTSDEAAQTYTGVVRYMPLSASLATVSPIPEPTGGMIAILGALLLGLPRLRHLPRHLPRMSEF